MAVMGVFSRRLLGNAMGTHRDAELVVARSRRGYCDGAERATQFVLGTLSVFRVVSPGGQVAADPVKPHLRCQAS